MLWCAAVLLLAGASASPSRRQLEKTPPPEKQSAPKLEQPAPSPGPGSAGGDGGSAVSTYVTFHDSAGTPIQLYKKTWDKIVADTPLEPMDLEPAEAMQKEREMNSRVSSGQQDESAWHQHQYVMASTGNVDSARILIEYGVAPSLQKMAQDGSPLQLAAASGDLDAAEQILEDGDTGVVLHEMSQQPLIAAAMMGHADIVGLLLHEGHDPQTVGANGATALMVAASMGHLLTIDVLIQHGANVDYRHKFAGSTAIHFAAEMGQVGAVKKLCAAGADVESEKTHGGRPLHTAADTNQADIIVALLECGAKRDSLLMDDTTALYLAAQNGYTEVARALVEHRCDSELCRAHATGGAGVDFEMPSGPASTQVDTSRGGFGTIKSFFESGNGATALHAACENGHLGVVKVLATNGVDVNTRGMQGVTPLYSSISYNHPEITEYLVRRAKADVNRRMKRDGDTAMMIAIKFARGTSAHIPILLRAKGLDLEVRNKAGQTALMVAAGMGRHDVVQQLLFAGADASATVQKKGKGKGKGGDESSGSVLHVAIEQGSTVVVEQLLAAGADVRSVGPDGATLLHTAAESGWRGKGSIELLLARGLDIEARIKSTGATPLMMAAKSGAEDSAELLLEAGAEINAKAGSALYGMTALYMAAQENRLEVVKKLVEYGAKVTQRLDDYRVTPLGVAAERGHEGVVRWLLTDGGARSGVEMKDKYGRTPLASAASAEQLAVVRLLAEQGADVDTENKQGATPLLVAVKDDKPKVVELLLSLGAEEDVENAMALAKHEHDLHHLMKLLQPYVPEEEDEAEDEGEL